MVSLTAFNGSNYNQSTRVGAKTARTRRDCHWCRNGRLDGRCSVVRVFARVTIIEKDELPSQLALRKGVPQGAHFHTFLGYAVDTLDKLIPGLVSQLYAAGAVRIRRNYDIWFHDAAGPTPVRDVGIVTPSVTRPLLEHVTRQQVLRRANIVISESTRMLAFESNPEGHVNGVSIKRNDRDVETMMASLVVDCSGRGSRLARWLDEGGYRTVHSQKLDIAMGYTSGLFRPPPEWRDSSRACLMLAIPPSLRAAYVTPVDGGSWQATMYGRAGDNAPRDHQGFVEWTRGLAHPVIHERLRRAEPAGKLRSFGIPVGIWRRYDRMEPFFEGLLPLGEAFTSFNPMYGQGISLSAAQALSLRCALEERADSGESLRKLATPCFNGCANFNAVGWSVMETRDLAYSSTKGIRPDDLRERWRIGGAIRQLAERDSDVHRMMVRVTHLLEHSSVLQKPDIVDRALALLKSESYAAR